jgi:hypothetical protein
MTMPNFSLLFVLFFRMKSLLRTLFFLFSAGILFISCHTQNTETSTPAPPKDFHGIPPYGIGGDSLLNIQKNRWIAGQQFADVTISDVIAMQHDLLTAMGNEERYKWTSAAGAQAAANELQSVRLAGYIIAAKEELNESCNGNNNNYHDFHIWITDSLGKDKSKAIIAEATPFWKEQYPGWLLTKFEQLASQNAQVRISGWIMWDEDHPEQLGSSRASLWEIHPMTTFEFFNGSSWQTLQ